MSALRAVAGTPVPAVAITGCLWNTRQRRAPPRVGASRGRHRVALVLHAGHARVGGGTAVARDRGARRGEPTPAPRPPADRRVSGHPAARAAETTRAGLLVIAVRGDAGRAARSSKSTCSRVLQARHALSGQRIQVTRTPAGVTVEGLVEGGDRDELVRALRAVPHGAALRVNLSTPADLIGARPAAGTSITFEPARGGARRETRFPPRTICGARSCRAMAGRARRMSRSRTSRRESIASRTMACDHARTAFLEAATLSTLADRFDAARASDMSDERRRRSGGRS